MGAGAQAAGRRLAQRKGYATSSLCSVRGYSAMQNRPLLVTVSISILSFVKIVHNCGVGSAGAQRSELRSSTNKRFEVQRVFLQLITNNK